MMGHSQTSQVNYEGFKAASKNLLEKSSKIEWQNCRTSSSY